MSRIKYFTSSFIWVFISKLLDASIKFFSIPLLLNYFGKDIYGILVLALSTNAYLDLLDLGINTGAIKYYSEWIVQGKYQLIQKVARSSISFYLIVGVVNSIILMSIAFFGKDLFNISPSQFLLLQKMLLLIAIFSIVNWSTSILNQLLIADEKIQFIQRINLVKSVFNFLFLVIAIKFNLSMLTYFTIFLSINSLVIIPYYIKARSSELISTLRPGFDWQIFSPVLIYSLSIFAMALFQFTATQSRPIILAMFTTAGSAVLAEYRIIEVFPLFVISIGGMIITILLPITSRLVKMNQKEEMDKIAYKGTLFTSILVCCFCFPILINSRSILRLYVGDSYVFLSTWLNLWLITVVLYLHNSPVASMILATGKTRVLVYSSAIACCISIIINIFLCDFWGVGSAVVGYLVYIIIQMSFYYLYINKKILDLKSFKVFNSFLVPFGLGMAACIPIYYLPVEHLGILGAVVYKTLLWIILFAVALLGLKVIKLKELLGFINFK